jgi:hypothetical protein
MMTTKTRESTSQRGGTVRIAAVLVVAFAFAACAVEQEPAPPSSTSASSTAPATAGVAPTAPTTGLTTTSTTGAPTTTQPPSDGSLLARGEVEEALFEAIIADLVDRSGAARSSVAVVRAEEAIWSDGSLGCPQPGEFYTQALVPGYWVVFDVPGGTYDYRATRSGFFKLCPPGADARPPTG